MPNEKAKRPDTLDHLRSVKKPVTKSVRIATDQEVAEKYHKASNDYQLALLEFRERPHSGNLKEAMQDKKTILEKVEEELKAHSLKFVFRSLGRRKYDDLVKAHPITDEEREEASKQNDGTDPGIEWSFETFPDALIAKSLIEPELSEEEMLEWLSSDDWNSAEQQALFQAAFEANSTRQVVNLGKG